MASSRSVLVLNAGSSSLKYALYNVGQTFVLAMQGIVEQIGTPHGNYTHKNILTKDSVKESRQFSDHKAAMAQSLSLMGLDRDPSAVMAVGHRVVHGGEEVSAPCIIDERVKGVLQKYIPLAPLHNPANLQGINVAQELLKCPQVAVFDTAFHATIPPKAFTYGIPYNLYRDLHIRRYGFHGTSYAYLLEQTAKLLSKPQSEVNMIACHLGAGASIAAIKEGKCIDTSMGITPLEGLVMATRSGDVDPALGKIMSDLRGMSPSDTDTLLNKHSGLYGICGEKDMRTIVEKASLESKEEGEGDNYLHKLALDVFVHRVRRYIGAYLVHLGGDVDAIVFSAGIGERSVVVREMVCQGLEKLGIVMDVQRNADAQGKGAREVSAAGSAIKVLVVPTDEELQIARETVAVVEESKRAMAA